MSDLMKLAEQLTPRQREAILSARWIGSGVTQKCLVDYTDPWTIPVAHFFTLRTDCLNDLGLQVRAHLEGE